MNQDTTPTTVADLLAMPLRGPGWPMKWVIAVALVTFSPFLLFIPLVFYYGYLARLMRLVAQEGTPPALPEWTDWGELFVSGLKLFAAALVFSLPLFLLFAVGYASYFVPMFAGIAAESEELIGLLALLGMGTGWFLFGLGTLLGTVMLFILPAALVHSASHNSLAAAFHFGAWWRIFRANIGGFVVAGLLLFGLLAVLYMAYMGLVFTFIFCWLAPLVLVLLAVYLSLAHLALAADAYRTGARRLAERQALLDSTVVPAV